MGHIRRICPDRQEEEKTQAQGSAAIIDDGYDNAEVLIVTLNQNHEEWVWTWVAPIICVQEEIGFHPIKKLIVERCCWETT